MLLLASNVAVVLAASLAQIPKYTVSTGAPVLSQLKMLLEEKLWARIQALVVVRSQNSYNGVGQPVELAVNLTAVPDF